MNKLIIVCVVLVTGLAVAVASASATAPLVVIDTTQASLDSGDGGIHTVSLGFTNLSAGKVGVKAAVKGDPACKTATSPESLAPRSHTDIVVTIPASNCTIPARGDVLVVTAGSEKPFEIEAGPKPDSEPPWLWFLVFPLGAAVAGVLGLLVAGRWVESGKNGLLAKLQVDATWSFSDSWVTNVTAIGSILTGLFGTSDAVKTLLGADPGRSIALATLGSGAALIFVAAGAVLLLTLKTSPVTTTGKKDLTTSYTVIGLVLASALTFAGALGELLLVARATAPFKLGWDMVEDIRVVWVGAAIAAVSLVCYAVKSTRDTIKIGTTTPDPPPTNQLQKIIDDIKAILDAVPHLTAEDDVHERIEDVQQSLQTIPDRYSRRERRSALL